MNKRRRYGADFKAKVALEALKSDLTLAQLATKHGVHQGQISSWRKQAVTVWRVFFSGKAEVVEGSPQVDIEKLHAKIGQLVVERDFLAFRRSAISLGD